MPLTGHRTFVGFGFGAIQAGLFLYEAFRSGGFARLVVGEVAADAVEDLRRHAGCYAVNVAYPDRVETARVGPVQAENPNVAPDIEHLVDAIGEAEEIATAVPSVRFYTGPHPGSIHRILAAGLRRKLRVDGPPAVVYAAENHNHAAEILETAVLEEIPAAERAAVGARVRFLNTVIGKMSGVIAGAGEARARHLATITPDSSRVFLVEAFNRILISRIDFPAVDGLPCFQRGIAAFAEKPDLLPFEEAKLYGHNAAHALAAYLGAVRGLHYISELRREPRLLGLVRDAFLKESGVALIRKHTGRDRLFSVEGFRKYALDLLERMTNPYLQDSVERVGRDPQRKLGWDDRLVGTMRLALQQNVVPRRFALGAAAALAMLEPTFLKSQTSAANLMAPVWGSETLHTPEARDILRLVEDARDRLMRWRQSDFQDIDKLAAAG